MSTTIHWVLFQADPSIQPPFSIKLGTMESGIRKEICIENCQHIQDAVEKIKKWVLDSGAVIPSRFTLLYPIYLQIMGSDFEDTMHQVAWLIKDEADKNHWQFNRIDGLDGSKKEDFYL